MEVVGMAGLACGMIAVGSCNPDVTATIVQTLMEKSETELHDTYARFLPLGLGLCHLGEFTVTGSACVLCCSFSGLIPIGPQSERGHQYCDTRRSKIICSLV
jgi:hypothetical protein